MLLVEDMSDYPKENLIDFGYKEITMNYEVFHLKNKWKPGFEDLEDTTLAHTVDIPNLFRDELLRFMLKGCMRSIFFSKNPTRSQRK